jgi:hypothetical protein
MSLYSIIETLTRHLTACGHSDGYAAEPSEAVGAWLGEAQRLYGIGSQGTGYDRLHALMAIWPEDCAEVRAEYERRGEQARTCPRWTALQVGHALGAIGTTMHTVDPDGTSRGLVTGSEVEEVVERIFRDYLTAAVVAANR